MELSDALNTKMDDAQTAINGKDLPFINQEYASSRTAFTSQLMVVSYVKMA